MNSFYIPSGGSIGWRALLAEPDKHWKDGRSAKLLAERWEGAGGFPDEVAAVLALADSEVLHGLEFVIGFPEWKTPLPGGSRPSQTDLLVLARNSAGQLIVIGIEGKVDEPFGPTVAAWGPDATPGRKARLDYLCDRLGLDPKQVGSLRYQLLHRTVSAVIEADRFGAAHAVMLVHSFDPARAGFADYRAFAHACGSDGLDILGPLGSTPSVSIGWATGPNETEVQDG